MFPLWAERITFSANSMTGTAGNTSDTTTLSGSAYVLTSSMEISADSITMSGKNFRYIEAEGNITGKNIETKMEFTCASLSYDRRTKIATLKDNVRLTDTENGVSVEAQLIEYNQNTDIARIQIGITIKQKDNVCSSAYAVYRKKNKMLEMSGNARITQGEDTFRAQQITLNLDTQEITLDGRVKGSVVDEKNAERDQDTKKDSAADIDTASDDDTSDKNDASPNDGLPSEKEGGADRSGDAASDKNASSDTRNRVSAPPEKEKNVLAPSRSGLNKRASDE